MPMHWTRGQTSAPGFEGAHRPRSPATTTASGVKIAPHGSAKSDQQQGTLDYDEVGLGYDEVYGGRDRGCRGAERCGLHWQGQGATAGSACPGRDHHQGLMRPVLLIAEPPSAGRSHGPFRQRETRRVHLAAPSPKDGRASGRVRPNRSATPHQPGPGLVNSPFTTTEQRRRAWVRLSLGDTGQREIRLSAGEACMPSVVLWLARLGFRRPAPTRRQVVVMRAQRLAQRREMLMHAGLQCAA